MNILIVSYVYPHEKDPRLGLFVHEQAKELVRQGNKVFVLTSGAESDRKEIKDGIVVYRLSSGKFLKGLRFGWKSFAKILGMKKDIQIMHLHFVGLNSLFCGIASRLSRVPMVATAHGIDVCPRNFLHGFLIKCCLAFPKKIMCVSRFTMELAALSASGRKLVVVNNGVDIGKLKLKESPKYFRKKIGLENKKILLSVGGLVERKGHKVIIKALAEVVKQIPNVVYLIIGVGSEEKNLRELAASLNLQGHIRFLGYVSDKEIANYFDACDVFVLMSKTIKEEGGIEGFGIAYIEASAMGKPVIGGKSGGTGDAIIEGVTGFRIEPDDKKELIKMLVLLLNNAKLREKMGAAGRKMVLKKFLWKHNVEKTLKVYRRALSSV